MSWRLPVALDEAKAVAPGTNHLIEPVFFAELGDAGRRELAGQLIQSDLLTHQMVWGSYVADESLPAHACGHEATTTRKGCAIANGAPPLL